MSDKTLLRKKYTALRDSLDSEYREACDNSIAQFLFLSEEYSFAKEIFVYVSARSEVDTFAVINRALADGKKVAVPHCRDGLMNFYYIGSTDELVCSQFGIPTVDVNKAVIAVPCDETLCVVPALSFDREGNRLGYGGGYYDRFLALNKVKTAGLCREVSVADSLPAEKYDVKIDCVITEKSVIRRRVNGGKQ